MYDFIRSRKLRRIFIFRIIPILLLSVVFFNSGANFATYLFALKLKVETAFHSKTRGTPSRIFGRPLVIQKGQWISPDLLAEELAFMGYGIEKQPESPGTFFFSGNYFDIHLLSHSGNEGKKMQARYRIRIKNGIVTDICNMPGEEKRETLKVGDPLIGNFLPPDKEDRIMMQIEDASPLLIDTLLLVEDRRFFSHHGIVISSMLSALFDNLISGDLTARGASTITQQLVKNLCLSSERTFSRKQDEIFMALLLEHYHEKREILEAYMNEVYLGQDGSRAIHGFALAAQFYFKKSVSDLTPGEIALLVGMLKAPSATNPFRHPDEAKKRQRLILGMMRKHGLISSDEMERNRGLPSHPGKPNPKVRRTFPAYTDFVNRRLLEMYHPLDLQTKGFSVRTAFDPQVQFALEKAIVKNLGEFERKNRNLEKGDLEAAAVVIDRKKGKVIAIAGGREPGFAGFNRALDAKRSIGSLVKPGIYLTALKRPETYNLATMIDDSPITIKDPGGAGGWSPNNFDGQFHGPIPLYQAFIHSYNAASVRLGMETGLEEVIRTLKDLGIERYIPPYPSIFLGSVGLSPMDVSIVYDTIASGGIRRNPDPLVSITVSGHGEPMRLPSTTKRVVDPHYAYCLEIMLEKVVEEGTASGLLKTLPPGLKAAGKTGTSNDYRDSWFAGFTGSLLCVVWVGRDDNRPCGLSGSAGAMRIWGSFMESVPNEPLKIDPPELILWMDVDTESGLVVGPNCSFSEKLPFITGFTPEKSKSCPQEPSANQPVGDFIDILKKWFFEHHEPVPEPDR